jgi:hypothetical protein
VTGRSDLESLHALKSILFLAVEATSHSRNPSSPCFTSGFEFTMPTSSVTSSKSSFTAMLASVTSKLLPHSSEGDSSAESSCRSSTSSKRSSSWSGASTNEVRAYRSSARKAYQVHEMLESDYHDSRPATRSVAFRPPPLPAPSAIPDGPFAIADRMRCPRARETRRFRARELEVWPSQLHGPQDGDRGRAKQRMGVQRRTSSLATLWESEEEG